MASFTVLPHINARTIDEKLSSIRIIEEASFATSVPDIPMENPTSAFFSAAPSLVPSPVTATTSPISCNFSTKSCLSNGDDLANICSFGSIFFISASFNSRN
eukprot:NODE_145_length_15762_cov_0.655238.p11 type:complete len:102 gc:universal NODE_145_length_15762_cov_0.655238:3848-4153(+)